MCYIYLVYHRTDHLTGSSHRVLQALIHPLTHYLKFHVLRYNARGVGLSSGWKSFTGLQEGEDLHELVRYALKRLNDVREVAFIVRVPSLSLPTHHHLHCPPCFPPPFLSPSRVHQNVRTPADNLTP